jgi:hypothetical protein
MKGERTGSLARRAVSFLLSQFALLVTAALAIGVFLAFQAKLPVALERFTGKGENRSGVAIREYSLPISAYGGPVLVRIEHGAMPIGSTITLKAGGQIPAVAYITSGERGERRFILYPGAFSGGGKLRIEVSTGSAKGIEKLELGGEINFPKAGYWLLPDPWLWIALVAMGVILGAAAAVLWAAPLAVKACYVSISILLVLLIHFIGIEFAVRLAWMLPGAVLLLIAAIVFRAFFPEKAATLQSAVR